MDRELSYWVGGIISQMKQNVNYRRRCTWVLGAVAVLSGLNLLLQWLGIGFRLYFSAAAPFYADFFTHALSADPILRLLVGICAILTCLLYLTCLFSPQCATFGLCFYAVDTILLLGISLFGVDNPICCLPELFTHGLILLLLAPPLRLRGGRAKIC